ncbi:hypothetical protein LP416_22620 [Polaromonas sp. P2-4]|nr:hypothetical protein LP416_22620 [Polaromonas sp. P2-4]
MENQRKVIRFDDIGDDARRQYIDAKSSFEALESALVEAAAVRGGMYWKTVGGVDYLIRTSPLQCPEKLGAPYIGGRTHL